jgi:hypothetical protein
MNLKLRIIVAASLGLSSSLGVCSVLRGPNRAATAGSGNVGGNGLDPAVYVHYIGMIMDRMNERLSDGKGNLSSNWASIINDESDASLTGGTQCKRQYLVRYLVECTLPEGTSLTYSGPRDSSCDAGTTWQGHGLLWDPSTSMDPGILYKNWDQRSPALTPREKQAILTCMATRMNFIEGVNILMEGKRVYPKCGRAVSASASAAFPVEEGYWGVLPDTGAIYYWPPESSWRSSQSKSSATPTQSPYHEMFKTFADNRACSDSKNPCHVMEGAGACTFDGGWTCHTGGTPDYAVPVFETRITCFDCCADAGYHLDCATYSDGGCVCGTEQSSPWPDAGVCP